MSLNIYTRLEDIPGSIKLIRNNDSYFKQTILQDTPLVREVLKEIDKAEYSSPLYFIGRDKNLGALNKSCLSTGCKTLLNIIQNPDTCFDVMECGPNALALLPKIRNGNILWQIPTLASDISCDCDIVSKNKHFSNFSDFLDTAEEFI